MKEDNTIIEIDGHKLVYVIAPEVEDDRGFVKFFRKELAQRMSEEVMIETAKLYGNSFPLKVTQDTITENNYIARFKKLRAEDVNHLNESFISTRSFFNDTEGRYSAVIFAYASASSVSDRVEYGLTVVDFHQHSNPESGVLHALKNIGGLQLSHVVGDLH